ncbi:FACT complex subunit spt16 [Scheffersomyces spartinae]|uniref:FACT complex subunit n=1 Tax=Scheffersomyces spartinae TaxID=45513 RepID=A0A9P8AGE2_9ASCO|nr:FACT complex subunit spt16 [Scheffersomyces spartinae]KAG7192250.1 FACT complex subunit spt16 [Scheffersomyces spartinae]
MSDVKVDVNAFHKRLSLVQRTLVQEYTDLSKTGLLFFVGASDDENTYKKSTVLQIWLLGYEFLQTLLFITQDKAIFITSEAKAKHLRPLLNKPSPSSSDVEIWARTGDAEHNRQLFVKLLDMLKLFGDGNAIGSVVKDKYRGKLINEWEEVIKDDKEKLKFEDCSGLISECMEVKDLDEYNNTQIASKCSVVMMDGFMEEMMVIVDEELKTLNAQVSDKLEDSLEKDNKWYTKLAMGKKLLHPLKDFDADNTEWCYSPIVQSGGEYDLRPSALSNDKRLVGEGVILASLGIRYKSYCSNIGRTFLVDPTPQIEENYDFLLKLQAHIISNFLKEGKTAQEVFQGATEFIKTKNPSLLANFTKNCGWLMGIEFRDSSFILNGKNTRKLKNGQVFSLTIGFNNLTNTKAKNPKLQNYGLLLTDTFKVTESDPILLTNYPKSRSEVSFFFNDDEPNKKQEANSNKVKSEIKSEKKGGASSSDRRTNSVEPVANSKILKSKLRHESNQTDDNANAEKRRQEAQRILHGKRQEEGLARFSKADATDSSDLKPVFKRYESYLRESQIPNSVRDLKIHIDYRNQTILLPICGRPVPFHINSFKNGSTNEEGDFTYLRLNFNSPGIGGNASRKNDLPYEDSPDNTFVRSMTFRSRDRQRMVDVFKAIQDLKKDAVKREQERKQLADVVTQANLNELKGSRVKKLEQVFIRPQPDTKKIGGVLEIHENGLRYQSAFKSDQKVDILFSNIKHLFFQPCKDELIVIIHCHLKSPLMIGKRKSFDIQFYREASDMAFDETGGRKRRYRYGDEDELQQEEEERKRKALLDKEFKKFAELIAESSHGMIDLDMPFRELGFQGVPFRSAVLCMPTRDCLVLLVDPPYLVLTLEEIELAHLERVQFGLKNFDMVFVFKDFSKPVVHVNTIPMELLEDVKNWLTDVDIPYSEGPMSLNWGAIMKTVQADPYSFFAEDGGWTFLTGDGDSDEEEEEEEESEFEVTDEEPEDDDDEEAYSEEDNFSSDGSGSEGSFEESEGEDWDELERKAIKEDKAMGRE